MLGSCAVNVDSNVPCKGSDLIRENHKALGLVHSAKGSEGNSEQKTAKFICNVIHSILGVVDDTIPRLVIPDMQWIGTDRHAADGTDRM